MKDALFNIVCDGQLYDHHRYHYNHACDKIAALRLMHDRNHFTTQPAI